MFFMSGKTLPTNREGKTNWNWASYFALKKQKLQEQFNEGNLEKTQDNEGLVEASRNLFKDVGIFVNGYTNPTAIELKALMHRHGGVFFEYPNDRITHYVASNLAHSKAIAFRNKLVVRPEWILDCIKEKRILSTDSYLVIAKHDKNQNKLSFTSRNSPKVHLTDRIQHSPCKKAGISSPIKKEARAPPGYINEYKCFKQKIEQFELPDYVSRFQSADELEKEKLKHLLSDWIFWTSRNRIDSIDQDDLNIFRGYLIYLLITRRQLEKLVFILKILKRIIEKNGSFDWIEAYKELYTYIQSEFYVKFDSTIKLD